MKRSDADVEQESDCIAEVDKELQSERDERGCAHRPQERGSGTDLFAEQRQEESAGDGQDEPDAKLHES